jgi:glycosyltransferase involved in cell wall biosynthesis
MAIAKVAHLASSDIGIRVHLRKQMVDQQARGYDVHGITPPGQWITADGMTGDGIPVKLVNYSSSARTPIRDLRALIDLVRYFRAERFDIVHTHGLKPGLLGRLAARLARVPIVVHTIHGLFFYEGMSALARRGWAQVERLGMRLGDYALSQNREDIEVAIAMGLCPPDRIGYLGNGIELSVFAPDIAAGPAVAELRRSFGVRPGEKVVCIAGRFIVEKGHLEFFEAARRIRAQRDDVHFWAAGAEQPERPGRLMHDDPTVAQASQVVRFLGMRWDMPAIMAAADVFVFPSHGREGIPRVLMEAAAMERAIVTTDVRGCREVIQHGATGLLVARGDAGALTGAIVRLLDDEAEARRLGAGAGQYARRHFDENAYCERIADCYERLLRNAMPRSRERTVEAGARRWDGAGMAEPAEQRGVGRARSRGASQRR